MNKKETRIKNVVKHLTAVLMAVMLVMPMFAVTSSAASNVAITGGDSVAGGETFTVTVTYSGDNVGRVAAGMTYDTSMLTYISGGSSSGNNGWIQLNNAGTGEDITFNLKFQALTEGTTSLSVETREIYDLGEMEMGVPAVATKDVVISGNAADDQLVDTEQVIPETDSDKSVVGVDEKENVVNTTLFLVIGAVVIAILIIVIAIVIRKKK